MNDATRHNLYPLSTKPIVVMTQEEWDEVQSELARLSALVDVIMGIGTPHLDSFTDSETERYSQLSPPQTFRMLLDTEAKVSRLSAPRWEPVEYKHIFTRYGKPLRPDYEQICDIWHEFNTTSRDSEDYEYAICRLAQRPQEDRTK
jgi:hypothetical protein